MQDQMKQATIQARDALEQAAKQAGIPLLNAPQAPDLDELFARMHASQPRKYAAHAPVGRAGGVLRCALCGAPAGRSTLMKVEPKPGVHEGGYVCIGGDCAGEDARYLRRQWRRILTAQKKAKGKTGRRH